MDQWLQGVSLGTNGKIASINNGDTSWKILLDCDIIQKL